MATSTSAADTRFVTDSRIRYVGTMQICVARMLQESGIFFGVCTSFKFPGRQSLIRRSLATGSVGDRLLARPLRFGCRRRYNGQTTRGKALSSTSRHKLIDATTYRSSTFSSRLCYSATFDFAISMITLIVCFRSPNYDRWAESAIHWFLVLCSTDLTHQLGSWAIPLLSVSPEQLISRATKLTFD